MTWIFFSHFPDLKSDQKSSVWACVNGANSQQGTAYQSVIPHNSWNQADYCCRIVTWVSLGRYCGNTYPVLLCTHLRSANCENAVQ
jgi:hypothetical protein